MTALKARAYRLKHCKQIGFWRTKTDITPSKARYRIKLKREVMALYSNPVCCIECGFSKLDGLVLPGLQVLCANCNTIKQLRNGRKKTIRHAELLAEIEAYANPVTQ